MRNQHPDRACMLLERIRTEGDQTRWMSSLVGAVGRAPTPSRASILLYDVLMEKLLFTAFVNEENKIEEDQKDKSSHDDDI